MPDSSTQYAARKVKRARWERAASSAEESFFAEAIKSDLTDETGTLSFWKCDDTEQGVTQVILAIASAHAHLETTDVILVPLADLTEAAASVTPTTGRTPFTAMADRHIDVAANSAQIALIAALFVKAINANQCRRMTRRQIRNGIAQAVLDGSIAPGDLAPGIRRYLPEPAA